MGLGAAPATARKHASAWCRVDSEHRRVASAELHLRPAADLPAPTLHAATFSGPARRSPSAATVPRSPRSPRSKAVASSPARQPRRAPAKQPYPRLPVSATITPAVSPSCRHVGPDWTPIRVSGSMPIDTNRPVLPLSMRSTHTRRSNSACQGEWTTEECPTRAEWTGAGPHAQRTSRRRPDVGGERVASISTLIESAKTNGLDAEAYLTTSSPASPTITSSASANCAPGIRSPPSADRRHQLTLTQVRLASDQRTHPLAVRRQLPRLAPAKRSARQRAVLTPPLHQLDHETPADLELRRRLPAMRSIPSSSIVRHRRPTPILTAPPLRASAQRAQTPASRVATVTPRA